MFQWQDISFIVKVVTAQTQKNPCLELGYQITKQGPRVL